MELKSRRGFLTNAFVGASLLPECLNQVLAASESSNQLSQNPDDAGSHKTSPANTQEQTNLMKIHYLEIVTKDVDAACRIYANAHGITFSEPNRHLGNARTVKLADGGMLGIRAPMHEQERPVIRPYFLVKDIDAAVKAAAEAGAEIALPSLKIPEHGTCAIFFHNGVESALWQL